MKADVRALSSAACLALLVLTGAGDTLHAQATYNSCGQAPPTHWYTRSLTVQKTQDQNTVTALFKVSAVPCGMYGDVQLVSPSGRTSELVNTSSTQDFGGGLIELTAQLPMNYEDGIYVGTGRYKLEDESTNPFSYYPGPGRSQLFTMTSNPTIGGFVQLVGTYWSKPSIALAGDSATFYAVVKGTNGCTGTSLLNATLQSEPANSIWVFGAVSSPARTTTEYATIAQGGVDTPISFLLSSFSTQTSSDNMYAESVIADTPNGCAAKPPASGNSGSAKLRVTP